MSDPSKPDPTPSSDPARDGASGGRWIAVAHLLRPQGRRGELLADPLTDRTDIFGAGRVFRLAPGASAVPAAPSFTLQSCWPPKGRNAGRLVLKLAGIDSISAAEERNGQQLFVLASALPALDPDTFLVRDLVGCELFDGTRPLGTVTDLQFPIAADGRTRIPEAADLLVLHLQDAPTDAEPVLIPFVKAWLQSVSIDEKRIVMHLPPGLLDGDNSASPSVDLENS